MTAAVKPPATAAEDFWSGPSWREVAIAYHKDRPGRTLPVEIEPKRLARLCELLADNVSLERVWAEVSKPSGRAAGSTVEALMFALRDGLAALEHPDNQRRLSELNDEQMKEVAARVQKFMPRIGPAWKPADVQALLSLWNKLRCLR